MSIIPQGTHWAARNPLQAAQAAIGKAAAHLRTFHARQGEYVSAGHSALARIDEAIGELHRARGILVDEIRRDQDERGERVERLLAEGRSRLVVDWGDLDDSTHGNSGPGGERR